MDENCKPFILGDRSAEVFRRLLKERIIIIGTPIDDTIANLVSAQMLFLQTESMKKDIQLYVNSPGGSVTACLAIHGTMKAVKCDVATYGIGQAAGGALLLLTAGTKRKRFALPRSRLMFTDVWGGKSGSAKDIAIHEGEIARLKRTLCELFATHTGHPVAGIEQAMAAERSFSAQEGVDLGLVDDVIESTP